MAKKAFPFVVLLYYVSIAEYQIHSGGLFRASAQYGEGWMDIARHSMMSNTLISQLKVANAVSRDIQRSGPTCGSLQNSATDKLVVSSDTDIPNSFGYSAGAGFVDLPTVKEVVTRELLKDPDNQKAANAIGKALKEEESKPDYKKWTVVVGIGFGGQWYGYRKQTGFLGSLGSRTVMLFKGDGEGL